jgi:hypothetical protein
MGLGSFVCINRWRGPRIRFSDIIDDIIINHVEDPVEDSDAAVMQG